MDKKAQKAMKILELGTAKSMAARCLKPFVY